MFKSLVLASLALFASASFAQVSAMRLGSARLSNADQRLSIDVPNTCGVTAIRMDVSQDRANIQAIFVDLRNGTRVRFPINSVIRAGGNTGWLNLPGDARCVTRVIVAGRSGIAPESSRLVIYAAVRGGSEEEGGARNLGSVTLREGFSFAIRSITPVCNISEVRLRVTRDAATINYISLRFNNGESQRLEVRQNFAAGSSSAWKDLKGNKRCISGFTIVGSSGPRAVDSVVQLIGR